MGKEKDSGMVTTKAFRRRSLLFTLFLGGLALVVLAALACGVLALFFKDTWRDVRTWAADRVESTRLTLFRSLGRDYVEASDLKDEDKKRWSSTIDRMTEVMKRSLGSEEQRRNLRSYFDRIADAMKDDEIRSAELEPLKAGLEALLADIDETEKAKQG